MGDALEVEVGGSEFREKMGCRLNRRDMLVTF